MHFIDNVPREILVFAQLADGQSELASSSSAKPLQLKIGQRKPRPIPRIPRPDDPMPHVFAQSLRRSGAKYPTQMSTKSHSSAKKNISNTLLTRSHPTSKNQPSSKLPWVAKNTDQTKSAPEPPDTPGKRKLPLQDSTDEQNRRQKRRVHPVLPSNSHPKMKDDPRAIRAQYALGNIIPLTEEAEDEKNDFISDPQLVKSPSPLPATLISRRGSHPPTPDTLNSPTETRSGPGLWPEAGILNNPIQSKGLSKSQSRANSVVAGTHGGDSYRASAKSHHHHVSLLEENKAVIRKSTAESLSNRAIGKTDPRFKDLFGTICRGVQFALREILDRKLVDSVLTKSFVENHLAMYLIVKADDHN